MQHPVKDPRVPTGVWAMMCAEAHEARMAFVRRVVVLGNVSTRDWEIMQRHWNEFDTTDKAQLLSVKKPTDEDIATRSTRVLVFDTETTGIGTDDEVIQLGYVVFDTETQKILVTHDRIWRTEKRSHPRALAVHHLTDEKVRASPYSARTELRPFLDIVAEIHEEGGLVVAHNAAFDVGKINHTAKAHGLSDRLRLSDVFCTYQAVRGVPRPLRGRTCKNVDVYKFLGGSVKLLKAHDALDDAKMTGFVYFTGKQKRWW